MGTRPLRLFFVLTLTFLLVGVAGCLLHECGHALVAKCFGYDSVQIHYGSTGVGTGPTEREFHRCLTAHPPAETGPRTPPGHPCRALHRRVGWEGVWITAGGPLCNMLIGSLGFGLVLAGRRRFLAARRLRAGQWTLVFLAFFWSRQLMNFAMGSYSYFLGGHFSRDDEVNLALFWGWPRPCISLPTAVAGLVIMSTVTFRYIPRTQRLPLILAGLTGGALCVWLWLKVAGPVLLP